LNERVAYNKYKKRTIFRSVHDTQHPFVVVSNATAQDCELSFEAKGILLYLLSQGDNWTIQLTDLQRKGRTGRDRVNRIMKELEKHGYAIWSRKKRQRNHPDGTFEWLPPVISERPFTENPQMVYPSMVKPVNGKTVNGKSEAYKERSLQRKKSTKEEEKEPSAHARLMDFLCRKIGPIPNGAKEGKAIKWLLANGYEPSQCEACFEFLVAQEWRTSSVSWVTVKSEIGAWLARSNKDGSNQQLSRRETASERNVRLDRQNLEYLNSLSTDDREATVESETRLLAS
jgi:hypothetical protein